MDDDDEAAHQEMHFADYLHNWLLDELERLGWRPQPEDVGRIVERLMDGFEVHRRLVPRNDIDQSLPH